jgi:hypothetical protein
MAEKVSGILKGPNLLVVLAIVGFALFAFASLVSAETVEEGPLKRNDWTISVVPYLVNRFRAVASHQVRSPPTPDHPIQAPNRSRYRSGGRPDAARKRATPATSLHPAARDLKDVSVSRAGNLAATIELMKAALASTATRIRQPNNRYPTSLCCGRKRHHGQRCWGTPWR